MSVYKHNYRAYTGKLTPGWVRIFVLARYGYQDAWSSKITVGIFILCLLPCLVFLFAIYLANNPMARLLLGNHAPRILAINAEFFLNLLYAQFGPALVLAAWIAPRLITFDLADDALPILLSHPISRFGYVFGKWIALFTALSLVTWIPDLVLFAYQGYSSPQPWAAANLPIAIGLLAGAMIWIAFLSLLGLALSSWVKWRVVATGVIFAAILVPAGVGSIVSAVLRTKWGLLLNLPLMISILWQRFMGVPGFANSQEASLPTAAISAMLMLVCLLFLAMLFARIRAREVVRG
jgi:ABC-type transport system involved in multi-copper enzyme maturation permease subunit